MTDSIHIVFGSSAAQSLERSFQFNNNLRGEIFSLNDDLTIGPLNQLNKIEGINKRADWIKSTEDNKLFYNWVNFGSKDPVIIEQIKRCLNLRQKLCIWYGNNALDILSVSRLMFEIKPPVEQVFFVAVSESKQTSLKYGNEYLPRSLGVVGIEQIALLDKLMKQATPNLIEGFIKIWEDVVPKAGPIRILSTTGKILSKKEYFFDKILISNCISTFRKSAVVIGHSFATTSYPVGDATLNWRLKELVKQNQIEGKGILNEIRDYEVRLKQSFSSIPN